MPIDIHTSAASGARLAIRLLQDAAEKGDIDPWDIDVINVIDGFLDQLQQKVNLSNPVLKKNSDIGGGSFEKDLAARISSSCPLCKPPIVGTKLIS